MLKKKITILKPTINEAYLEMQSMMMPSEVVINIIGDWLLEKNKHNLILKTWDSVSDDSIIYLLETPDHPCVIK